jgi:hypothetical protein
MSDLEQKLDNIHFEIERKRKEFEEQRKQALFDQMTTLLTRQINI